MATLPTPSPQGREDKVILLPGAGSPRVDMSWRRAADQIWPAWQALEHWEETSVAELGPPFGELVLLLWSLHRFGGTEAGIVLASELLDRLPVGARLDPVLEDIVECAFALGAGWAGARGASTTAPPR
jgi:hypothetical protein